MQQLKEGTGESQKPYVPKKEKGSDLTKQQSTLEQENIEEEEKDVGKSKVPKSEIMRGSDSEQDKEEDEDEKQEEKPQILQPEEDDEQEKDYQAEARNKKEKQKQDVWDIVNPKNVKHNEIIWFDKTENDYEEEKILDNETLIRIEQDIQKNEAEKDKQLQKKGVANLQIVNLIKELNKRKVTLQENEHIVTEDKFQGIEEDDEKEYDYGRLVLRDETMEERLQLPYDRFEMYKIKKGESSRVAKVGAPTGCIMKATIKLEERNEEAQQRYEEEKDINILLPQEEEQKFKLNFFNPLICKSEIDRRTKETIYISTFMNIFRPRKKYKARLYLLRCLNLAARKNERDLSAMAAGYDSLSSTNPYPEIKIGDGKSETNEDLKYICEQQKFEKSTLDPNFFTNYEFDCKFPQDWKLELKIWDHVDYLWDTEIGGCVIDIEDRFFGNPQVINKVAFETYSAAIQNELGNVENEKQLKIFNTLQTNLNSWKAKKNEVDQIPVEYRALIKDGKKTQQGMSEMWVEVMEKIDAQKKQMTKISKPEPEFFELRFIVWEIRKFMIPEGEEAISPFVKVIYDPEGWTGNTQEKETDNHNGSEDGCGQYNWRMKFKVKLPTQFPRVKIAVYNFSTFGDDTLLGQTVLDWGRYFRKLKSEGKCNIDQQWIPLTNPADEKKLAGEILLSAKIVDMHEATQKPVGESWDEPNQDPTLEKPDKGRGMLDFLKGTALDVTKLAGLFNFAWIKKLIAIGGSLLVLCVLFVYPGVATGG